MVSVARTWLNPVFLQVREVFLLHRRKSCVLDKHVIHELIPVYSAARISIDSHEQLIELLEVETLAQNSAESCDELHKTS